MSDPLTIIKELLQQQTPVTFCAGGPSMNPTIRDGDLVRIQPLDNGALPPGSVILYRINGRIALHRFILQEATGRCFVAGDAATTGGDWIQSADVLGIAEWVQRGDQKRRLDTRQARWTGRLRYALRPIRRLLVAVYRRIKRHS